MPELPDIEAYMHALRPRLVGQPLVRTRVINPFALRSVEPAIESLEGSEIGALMRLGKRIVLEFATNPRRFIVIHLMIAGRFQWKAPGAKPPGRITQALFALPTGTLVLTEAGTQRRASIHVCEGDAALREHDPGGLELLDPRTDAGALARVLRAENRTLKRALTDPRAIAGVGNAYSDEILLEARLSPILLTHRLTDEDVARLLGAARSVLSRWTRTLSDDFARRFPGPGGVTAFRPEFGAHGKFKAPCPHCGTPIQRIVRGDHETNYCPRCQTGGKVLADRSLSRLLKTDWPKTADDL